MSDPASPLMGSSCEQAAAFTACTAVGSWESVPCGAVFRVFSGLIAAVVAYYECVAAPETTACPSSFLLVCLSNKERTRRIISGIWRL